MSFFLNWPILEKQKTLNIKENLKKKTQMKDNFTFFDSISIFKDSGAFFWLKRVNMYICVKWGIMLY